MPFVRFQHVANCSLTIHDRCAVLDVNLLPSTCGQAEAGPPRRATSYLPSLLLGFFAQNYKGVSENFLIFFSVGCADCSIAAAQLAVLFPIL